MLSFEQVSLAFGATRALDGVSFEAQPGEVLALCGQNGAGKSTTVKILAGMIPAGLYKGTVRLNDAVLQLTGRRAALDQGIAYLPQETQLMDALSVGENVMAGRLASTLGVVRRKDYRRRAAELLERVSLSVDIDTPVRQLPPAERQLVCVARALSVDPRILILDEPTANLSDSAARRIFDVVRSISDDGRIVIYITHHLSEIAHLDATVVVLRGGKVAFGPVKRPTTEDVVFAMVGSRVETQRKREDTAAAPTVASVEISTLWSHSRKIVEQPLTFALGRGEIVGLAGVADSGAEDVLLALGGMRRRHVAGTLKLGDVSLDLAGTGPSKMRRQGVCLVPSDRLSQGLIPQARIVDNLLLGSEQLGRVGALRSRARETEIADGSLAGFGVTPADPQRPVRTLSGGNQQKVMLARAHIDEPRLILLLDPTRGVDVQARESIHRLIRARADSGLTYLVTSSDASELASLCDRVVVLSKGRIVETLSSASLSEHSLLNSIHKN